jgi:hypothetical protein
MPYQIFELPMRSDARNLQDKNAIVVKEIVHLP